MPYEVALVVIFGIVGVTTLGGLIAREIGKAVARRSGAAPGSQLARLEAEVAQMRDQAEGVEEMRHRLAEVEERLDFAERLLAQKRPPDRVIGGT